MYLRPLNIALVLITLLLGFTCLAAPDPISPTSVTHTIAPGILYTQEILSGKSPLIINVLRIDLKAAGVHVQTGQAHDVVSISGPYQGREAIHNIAARHHAIAAINADFFPFTGDPLGIAIRNGELISEPSGYRACLGITSNKKILLNVLTTIGSLTCVDGSKINIDGINRVPHDGSSILLTPTFVAAPKADKSGYAVLLNEITLPIKLSRYIEGTVDSVTRISAGEKIPQTPAHCVQLVALGSASNQLPQLCKRDDKVSVRFDVVSNSAPLVQGHYDPNPQNVIVELFTPIWQDVLQAVSGGPLLINDGEIALDGEAEGFSKSDFIDRRHPRTAAGVDKNGRLLLVTVDGRARGSQGVSLDEMAVIMKRLGAVQAMNLDGGGSTTMVVNGLVVNTPSDGQERPVADGLLILSDYAPEVVSNTYHIALNNKICAENIVAVASVPLHFQLIDAKQRIVESRRMIWGTEEGFGFVSQSGVFTGERLGKGIVAAFFNGKKTRVSIQIVGAAALPDSTASQKDPDAP